MATDDVVIRDWTISCERGEVIVGHACLRDSPRAMGPAGGVVFADYQQGHWTNTPWRATHEVGRLVADGSGCSVQERGTSAVGEPVDIAAGSGGVMIVLLAGGRLATSRRRDGRWQTASVTAPAPNVDPVLLVRDQDAWLLAGRDGSVIRADIRDDKIAFLHRFFGNGVTDTPAHVAPTPMGGVVAAYTREPIVRVWASPTSPPSDWRFKKPVRGVAPHPSKPLLAVASDGIRLVSLDARAVRPEPPRPFPTSGTTNRHQ